MKAFSGKFRVSTVSPTSTGPEVNGHFYGKGSRITLIPCDEPRSNPVYDPESTIRGEVHLGVLTEKASTFQVGQVYTLTLDA